MWALLLPEFASYIPLCSLKMHIQLSCFCIATKSISILGTGAPLQQANSASKHLQRFYHSQQ